jgi:diguanylate cyclase (GGDEF)-like protein
MPKFGLSIASMLVTLALVVSLPLTALVSLSVYYQYRSDNAAVQKHTVAITDAIAVRAEIALDQTRLILMGIAKRPEIQVMESKLCDTFLVDLHKTLQHYDNFSVFNSEREFVCGTVNDGPNSLMLTKYFEAYDRMITADDLALSPPVQGITSPKWLVFAAYPVKGAANTLLGAVISPVDLTSVIPVINSASLPAGSIIRLTDSKGLILSNLPDTNLIGEYDSGMAELYGKEHSGSSVAVGLDGVERVYAYTRVTGSDWIVSAGMPTAWVFANSRFAGNKLLYVLLGVFAIAATLAFIVAKRIVRPIHKLQQDAEILAMGQYSHRSEVVGNNEVSHLAAAFNKLSQALEKKEADGRLADIEIMKLNRVYSMLSQINALIVRVRNVEELFPSACKVAVDAGGFRMAMIVKVDALSKQVTSIVSAGKDEYLLKDIKRILASREGMQQSIVLRVIKGGKPSVTNNLAADPRLLFGNQYARAGVNSMVILPLIISGNTVGIFALYSSEIDFFKEEELKLKMELASNIAFAIDNIEKRKRVNYLAYYDELTGLANRTLFLERLGQTLYDAKLDGHKLAIGLVDLERFKSINDSFGRETGDALLKRVSEWLVNRVADNILLARINADCFAIMMPVVKSSGNIEKLIETAMADFLEHPFRINNNTFRVSAKMGVALFPDDGTDVDCLFKNAEAALKNAKKSGERYLFHLESMTSTVADKLSIENRLRDALDNEEFVLHYQPKTNIISGQVVGAEALIRWNDPNIGLVPPGSFIPILEEIGLINDVGRWAINKAIEDYLRWSANGLDCVRIAVNVSPLQLRNRNFASEMDKIIAIDPLVSAALELEVTESLFIADIEKSSNILQSIRAMGIPIAIDDFGTGFASLSCLSRLPLDTLKIDRSFVIEMETQEGRDIVSTIIRVAHALKLKVVAEGVETEEQLHHLRKLGCDEMQGFLFSKPVPAGDFEKLFLSSLK